MKTIAKHRGMKVTQTNYRPQFGYKALLSMLEKSGSRIDSYGKAKFTNSYYIDGEIEEKEICFEIRLSDHTKYRDDYEGKGSRVELEATELPNGSEYFTIFIDVVDPEGYQKAKELLEKQLS